MKPITRVAALSLVTLSLAAITAASAAAAGPEFSVLPSVKSYEESVGIGQFVADEGVDIVTCGKGTATGQITGMRTVGKVVFKLKECKSSGESGLNCPIKTPGAVEGEIVSNTLKGELGTVKSAEAATEVGVLARPESGKLWLELEGNACTPETAVSGDIAGEVGPIGELTDKGFINFAVADGKQKIQKIAVLSGLLTAQLTAFSSNVTEEKYETLESKEPMEVD
jgi:hypothetical protein